MKMRVMDYTLDVYQVGVYTDLSQLSKGVADYVAQADGECTELVAEQWDPIHSVWISYSPAVTQAQERITEIFDIFRRLKR